MSPIGRYRLTIVVLCISILGALKELARLQGEALGGHVSKLTIFLFFSSIVLGLAAAIYAKVLKTQLYRPTDQNKIDVEILSKLDQDRSRKN